MKFQVAGADAVTGEDRYLLLEATDENSAIVQAKSEGIFPYEIRPVDDSSPSDPGDGTSRLRTDQRALVAGSVTLGALALILLLAWLSSYDNSPKTIGPSSTERLGTSQPSAISTERERRIDAFADQQVEKYWQPIPGGNSREDAARLTKDILKARSQEELNRALEQNIREGR